MDVKQNREDAESKALAILKMGPEALNILVDFGNLVNERESDVVKKKKLLRAVIFAIGLFARKRVFMKPEIFNHANAVSLLCELSAAGYQSAATVLHNIGFSDADIERERLLSLPIAEPHSKDREISVNEALQEIKTAGLESYVNRVERGCYTIGYSKKHIHEIHRIGNTAFAYRMIRRS